MLLSFFFFVEVFGKKIAKFKFKIISVKESLSHVTFLMQKSNKKLKYGFWIKMLENSRNRNKIHF
jgi:hypothetical protein